LILRTALRCAFVALLIPILTGGAAAEGQGTEQQRGACLADAFRFCMSAIPNHRKIETCLRANRRSISSACYREIYDDDEVSSQRAVKRTVPEDIHAPE
jgi:hypothetical protein